MFTVHAPGQFSNTPSDLRLRYGRGVAAASYDAGATAGRADPAGFHHVLSNVGFSVGRDSLADF
jgi:hypothetical protein